MYVDALRRSVNVSVSDASSSHGVRRSVSVSVSVNGIEIVTRLDVLFSNSHSSKSSSPTIVNVRACRSVSVSASLWTLRVVDVVVRYVTVSVIEVVLVYRVDVRSYETELCSEIQTRRPIVGMTIPGSVTS